LFVEGFLVCEELSEELPNGQMAASDRTFDEC